MDGVYYDGKGNLLGILKGANMKKLFISVPMKGRTEEAIRESMEKMHKIAEVLVGEELEVIPSYIEHDPPETKHDAVYYLGRSIQMLADADYFACITNAYEWAGCSIEKDVADRYRIPTIAMPFHLVAPDAYEALRSTMNEGCSIPVCEAR